ncbi:MAG: amidohydrolase family protein [Verrucomicrobiota bacterium]
MIVDVNTSFGRWPFHKFNVNSTQALAKHLNAAGITRALISSIDGILYPDPLACDAELFKAVKSMPMLIPVPTINPCLANWRKALETNGLKAVKIIPNYHNYPLADPAVGQLMEVLADRRIPLIIQMRVNDERNQYPLMKIPGVDLRAVVRLANTCREAPVICLCAYHGEAIELVQKTVNVHVDISFIETFQTLPTLLRKIPAERILFGSHTPFLYTASAVMKLNAARLTSKSYKAIASANAQRLFDI